MQLNRPEKRRGQDPTIALINIVFLMLIFFLLAGTIASRGDGDIEMIRTSEAQSSRPPAGPIGITAEGEIHYGGETLSEEALLTALRDTSAVPTAEPEEGEGASVGEPVSVVADRALPARDLIAFLRMLREAGLSARIVTRSGGSL